MTAIKIPRKPKLAQCQEVPSVGEQLATIVERIRDRRNNYTIETGKDLLEAKELVPHGEWETWLNENFEWSQSTAQNYMNAAKAADKNPKIGILKPSALVALAAPNTPDSVKSEVIADIDAGNVPTPKAVKAKIAAAKAKPTIKIVSAEANSNAEHETKVSALDAELVERLKAVGFEAAEKAFEAAFPGAVIARDEEAVVQASA